MFPALIVLLAFVHPLLGADPAQLVTGLPGQPQASFKQYAGYVTVNSTAERNLFYWFYEADHGNHSSLPLTIWFNGGPGCSSVGAGALSELGPFRTNDAGTSLVGNEFSWNKVTNLIFVESPVGVGFSYATKYDAFNDANTAKDALTFILEWFKKFPEYSTNDLYLAGESYAGHYIPTLAIKILELNKHKATINFKGFAIGNAWTDPPIEGKARPEYLQSHSLISYETYQDIIKYCYAKNCSSCDTTCARATSDMNTALLHIDIYNIYGPKCNKIGVQQQSFLLSKGTSRISTTAGAPNDSCSDSISPYLNLKTVKAALHVSENITWKICNMQLHSYYSDYDFEASMLPLYHELLNSGLRIWIYSGDFDMAVPTIGTLKWIRALNLTTEVPWYTWKHKDQVGGWTQVFRGLTFATVRGAGHMVPLDQPEVALEMFTNFLQGSKLPSF